MSRRVFASLLLASGVAAGCGVAVAQAHHRTAGTDTKISPGRGGAKASPADAPLRDVRPVHAVAPAPTTAAAPVAAAPYHVAADDVSRAAKQLAADIALEVTTYDAGATAADVARTVRTTPAGQRALAQAVRPLVHAGMSSSGSIVYPQLGGLTPDAASVMVVVRQQVYDGSRRMLDQTRVLDVRLTRTPSGWAFDALASAGGEPVARPADLSGAAAAVVSDRRIWLPDSARWDIYRGAVSPTLLELMERIAARTPYAVTVLETGHPYDVFGTDHASLHSSGRAVDINTVGRDHVVSLRAAGSSAHALAQWLFDQPVVGQIGSPWDFDGAASVRSFTNDVHLDHIHVSV